ncbi:SDR family oxidoreductase [Roseomonas sp. E05]|uniref:SDR family oxidoreductase n=1 Tax=Roseomonas sp. E05 TaxID=3046310 RepID=UPI0024B8D64A|nr:SDR family oxidoreductase [Roseomonas sp. E05]MDJ0389005.1 SDR family oxidoreductase [Roseomonas sp. E05]
MHRHAEQRNGVVVVTGASAGVGRAVAHELARRGARIGLIARDGVALEELAGQLRANGAAAALPLPCDVADADAVFAAAARAETELGPIDAWINNAMATVFGPVHDITPQEFRRVTEVTYLGYVHGTMAALRYMRPRDRGTILQVGSALAYRSIPLQSAYCGAKHAIVGFTDSLRTELRHDNSNIKVTMVHLPSVNTPQFAWARTRMPRAPRPVGAPVAPQVVARDIVAALERPARESWLGSTTALAILSGLMAPGIGDRYLARTAVEGQLSDMPLDKPREGNLFRPVTGVERAFGPFVGEAKHSEVQVDGAWARYGAAAATALLACGLGVLIGRRQGR